MSLRLQSVLRICGWMCEAAPSSALTWPGRKMAMPSLPRSLRSLRPTACGSGSLTENEAASTGWMARKFSVSFGRTTLFSQIQMMVLPASAG